MALGSSWPWTDHEKNVYLRLSAATSALVMFLAADSMAIVGSVSKGRDDRATSADCRRCASGLDAPPSGALADFASAAARPVRAAKTPPPVGGGVPVRQRTLAIYSSVRTIFSQLA